MLNGSNDRTKTRTCDCRLGSNCVVWVLGSMGVPVYDVVWVSLKIWLEESLSSRFIITVAHVG